MYKLYHIINQINNHYYVGVTKNSLQRRFNSHKYAAKINTKSKFYDAVRRYGIDNFKIVLVSEFTEREECYLAEIEAIKQARLCGDIIYNLCDGGQGGFVVRDIEAWKERMRKARVGKKPALGMKHTEENRKIFSIASKKRWANSYIYPREEIIKLTLKEAQVRFGISQTHYYRLRHTTGEK